MFLLSNLKQISLCRIMHFFIQT